MTSLFGQKGCDDLGFAEYERKKDEKINGVIYDMPHPTGDQHGSSTEIFIRS